MRSRGYSQDTDAIHVFSVEDSPSRYVLRLVVMKRLVLKPERMGLTSTFTRMSAPIPLDLSPTTPRTVSPEPTVTRPSPGCMATLLTTHTPPSNCSRAPSAHDPPS